MSLLIGFKFSFFSSLFKLFCSFSLALLTEAKLLSLASISSLSALETVNFVSLFFPVNLLFFPSPSPLSLFVALCSASFLLSKSLLIEGVFEPNDDFNGVPRPNGDLGFNFLSLPEDLYELPFLTKLFFDFSIKV